MLAVGSDQLSQEGHFLLSGCPGGWVIGELGIGNGRKERRGGRKGDCRKGESDEGMHLNIQHSEVGAPGDIPHTLIRYLGAG